MRSQIFILFVFLLVACFPDIKNLSKEENASDQNILIDIPAGFD